MTDPNVIHNRQAFIPMNRLIDDPEGPFVQRRMRRHGIEWVVDRCGSHRACDRAPATDADGPWHSPLVETSIGIQTDVNPVAFPEDLAQLKACTLLWSQ